MTEADRRRQRLNMLRSGGVANRPAGVATFPELPTDSAEVHASSVINPNQAPTVAVSAGQISAGMAKMSMIRQLVDGGVDAKNAESYATQVYANAPETISVVDYNRVRETVGTTLANMKPNVLERAVTSNQFMQDAEFLLTSMGAVFGGLQQGLFGALSGERAASAAERIFPEADIREDDGTVKRKSVFVESIKGVTIGAAGTLLSAVSPVIWPAGPTGEALKTEARKTAKGILESDYRDDLLTGEEVIEYWMHGDGLLGSKLPDPGTPERETYDAEVRRTVAEAYASNDNEFLTNTSMGALAFGGAVFDVFADPLIVVSELPKTATSVLRSTAPISSRARITGAIADRTRKASDVLVALDDARKWVDTTGSKLKANPTAELLAQHEHAKRMLLKQQNHFNALAANKPSEAVLLRTTPRVNPDHIPKLAKEYVAPEGLSPAEATKAKGARVTAFVKGKVGTAVHDAREWERMLNDGRKALKAGDITESEMKQIEQEFNRAVQERDSWKNTQRWLRGKVDNPQSRLGSFLTEEVNRQSPYGAAGIEFQFTGDEDRTVGSVLRAINDNIKRGIAQGAPEDELLQWQHTYGQITKEYGGDLKARYTGPDTVERSSKSAQDIVRDMLVEQRQAAVRTDPTPVIDLESMDPTQVRQRVAFGPDQTEAAAEAARVLAAGGEIDDVAYYGMGIDLFNTSYGAQARPVSGSQSRGFGVGSGSKAKLNPTLSEEEWLGKDAWRTKIEKAGWQQTMAEKLGDFYTRGLYPGTWNIRPAGVLFHMREPMRALQSISPRLYTRVHDAMNAQHAELTRMSEVFSRELKTLGVYREVNGSYVLDSDKSQRFYQMMNMAPDSEGYQAVLATLSDAERVSLSRLRRELDFMADKLGVSGTDRHIEGYISHVFDNRWYDGGARPLEIRGFGATAEVFDPYLMERGGGGGYVEDLALALDLYARSAARKLHMEPLFSDMQAVANAHVLNNPGDKWFPMYVDFMINNFKGLPSTGGKWVDATLGAMNSRLRAQQAVANAARKAGAVTEKTGDVMHGVGMGLSHVPGKIGKFGGALAAEGVRVNEFGSQMKLNGMPLYNTGDASRTAMLVTSLAYSSVLGGSSRYFPMAIATGMVTTGGRYGLFDTVRGIVAMGTEEGRALARQAGIDKQWANIMEDAAWTKLGHLAASMPSFNGVTVVGPSITATENMIRGWTFHAALGDLMRKSGLKDWDEVVEAGLASNFMHEAVRSTEEVNHLFGLLGKPPVFGRLSKSGSAMGTQFLSFIPKQLEELMAQQIAQPGRIEQYMMLSGYVQRVCAKIGLDMSDYVGSGFLPKNPQDASSIAFETVGSLLQMTNEMAKMMTPSADPAAAKRSIEQFQRNSALFVPFANATHRMKASADAIRLGSLYTDDGTNVYNYDLGQFQWDDNKSTFENMAALPRGLLSKSGNPEFPTDLPAIMTGMNSTQRRMERQAYQASRAASARQMYRRQMIAESLQTAVNKNDANAFSQQLQLAIREGMLPPDITSMVERTYLEHALPRLMREQIKSDQSMLNMIDVLQRERAMYELQFGYSGGTE